jgi:hypothetical protein
MRGVSRGEFLHDDKGMKADCFAVTRLSARRHNSVICGEQNRDNADADAPQYNT